jgi:hypothetical protein
MKIDPKRLSNRIMSKAHKNVVDFMVDLYDSLSIEERKEIKEMFEKNRNLTK